jgi:CRP-like cAMP-binding protein
MVRSDSTTANKGTHSCADCFARQTSDWRSLSASDLSLVDKAKRTRTYEAGEALFNQGDAAQGIYCVQSGLIGLRRVDEQGNSILLRLSSAGTTVGYRAFLTKEEHRNTAEVLSPGTICFIDKGVVARLLEDSPGLGECFLQHCIEDMNQTESDYARSLTLGLKARFLHLIMIFYERLGFEDESGNGVMELPIQRNEIAALIGAQPESVSRVIRNLQNGGLVEFDKRRVVLRDIEAVLQTIGVQD